MSRKNQLSVYLIAAVCHEANRRYCQEIGDNTQKSWEEAAEWQRESAVKLVQFIINNPNAPVSALHESWMEEKERSGWKYGPVKDESKKEHHCLVPHSELPELQQYKDALFKGIVNALAPAEQLPEVEAPKRQPSSAKMADMDSTIKAIHNKERNLLEINTKGLAVQMAQDEYKNAKGEATTEDIIETAKKYFAYFTGEEKPVA